MTTKIETIKDFLRRAATMLLVMMLTTATAWAQSPSGNWQDYKASSLTESEDHETIYISTAEELALYAYNVNYDVKNAKGYYCARTVELQADIDLSAHYWTPIGNGSGYYFNGKFNGNGHTITGMNVPSDAATNVFAFVGYHNSQTSNPSHIDNLIFKDCQVTGSVGYNAMGGVAIVSGECYNGATVRNCLVIDCSVNDQTTSASGLDYTTHGAIVGYANGYNFQNNYYYNVSGNYGGGCAGEDKTGTDVARLAYAVTPDTYSTVSGSAGIAYDGKLYAPNGATVTFGHTDRTGYTFGGYTVKDADNGDVTVSENTFTMPTKDVTVSTTWRKQITITANSDTKTYDGTALTNNGYTVNTTLETGDNIESVTVTGSQTDAGTSDNVPSAAVIKNGSNEDVTTNYDITYANGTLTVNPKAVTVTADNKEKEYGQADPTLTATVEGLVGTDAVSYTLSREAGETVGTYTITPTGEASQGNYTVSYATGTLTITSNPTITLTANQAPDENYWTTFYCGDAGYTIDAGENACAYTATYGTDKVTLSKLGTDGKSIPAGTAVIIVADNNAVSMTLDNTIAAFNGTNNLHGVDVETSLADIQTSLGTGTFYVLGNQNSHFGFHKYTGTNMAPRKAFLLVNGSNAALARSLSIVFDDATGIQSVTADGTDNDGAWYTLDGRKLSVKPAKSGIYIVNGKKVVIK